MEGVGNGKGRRNRTTLLQDLSLTPSACALSASDLRVQFRPFAIPNFQQRSSTFAALLKVRWTIQRASFLGRPVISTGAF
jgi:hypothetical protein